MTTQRYTLTYEDRKDTDGHLIGWALHHPKGHIIGYGYANEREARSDLRRHNDEQTPAEERADERRLSREFNRGGRR